MLSKALVKSKRSNTKVPVKLSGQLREEWDSNVGVVQGCGQFPLLFAGYLECTMRQTA